MTEIEFDTAMAAAKLELKRAKGHVATELSPTGSKRVTEKMRVRLLNAQAAVDLLLANEIHQSRIEERKASYKERNKQRKRERGYDEQRKRERGYDAIYREKNREELNRKAKDRMAAFRQTGAYVVWLESSREYRKLMKEKYRRESGATPRTELAARAAERAAAIEQRRLAKADFMAIFIGPPTPYRAMTGAECYQWRIKNDMDFYARELDRAQRYKARTRPCYRDSIVGWSEMPASVKELKHLQYIISRQIERTENENNQRAA